MKTAAPQKKTTSSNALLPIGRLVGVFGIHGELKCDPSNAGRACFVVRAVLTLRLERGDVDVTIAHVREHKGRLLLSLEGVSDANAAQAYVGATFFAPRSALDIGKDEYLDDDLVGCAVLSCDGRRYGTVARVEHYPSSDMLVVGARLLPMVHAFIRSIDIAAKTIVVEVPPGLLDDDAVVDA